MVNLLFSCFNVIYINYKEHNKASNIRLIQSITIMVFSTLTFKANCLCANIFTLFMFPLNYHYVNLQFTIEKYTSSVIILK